MVKRKLFVLLFDIVIFVLVISLLAFTIQLPILFIFTIILAVVVDQYLVARRNYLDN